MTYENTQQTPDYAKAIEEINKTYYYQFCRSRYASGEDLEKARLVAICNTPAALDALGLCKKSERDSYKSQLLACMADCAEKIKQL